MRLKRLSASFSAAVLAFSSLLTVFITPLASAATTCTWTGGGTDDKFSNTANWNTTAGACNGATDGIPHADDVIKLPALIPAQGQFSTSVSLVNDLAVALGGVQLEGDSTQNSTAYTLDTLNLADGAAITRLTQTTTNYTSLEVSGTVSSTGDISTNIYAWGTKWDIDGTLTAQDGSQIYLGSDSTVGGLTVQKGAQVVFNTGVASRTISAPIAFGGGSGSGTPRIYFGCLNTSDGCAKTTWNVTGAITLNSDAIVKVTYVPVTVNIKGAISGAGFAITKDPTSGGSLNIDPSSNSSDTKEGAIVNPTKTTKLTGTVNDSVDVVDNETAILDGRRNSVNVYAGGVLKGTGSTLYSLSVDEGGVVAPGHSPGCITVGDSLYLDGTYRAELGGTKACTGYDQLKVTGDVYVTNATLDVSFYGKFLPKKGDSFTIIQNDGNDAVNDTFKGLAEGATFKVGNGVFKISYKGGTGNDVVITAQNTPTSPDTGLAFVTANPLTTLAITTLAAGAIALSASRMQKTTARRR